MFDRFDFWEGDLPPWLTNFVTIARPLFVAANVAIPAVGAFTVGVIALVDPDRAMAMTRVSTAFLQGIPDIAWVTISTLALGYIGAKTWETVKAPPPPEGRLSPEKNEPAASPQLSADAPTDDEETAPWNALK